MHIVPRDGALFSPQGGLRISPRGRYAIACASGILNFVINNFYSGAVTMRIDSLAATVYGIDY
jgi:hypothetical protein